ncbi:glycerophosphodiester phosphodiesterase family protein [Vreelandella aquamarina]
MTSPSRSAEQNVQHPAITLPRLIAHRGYSAAAPENTLAAVQAAHAAGAAWVELDVQLLGDGTPVIWHDGDVVRCSDGRGKLEHLDWEQAQRLDAGAWFSDDFVGERMASLEAMLSLLNALDMGVNMELKVNKGRDPHSLVETCLPLMRAALPPERMIISSFNQQALQACREQAGADELALGILCEAIPADWQAQAESLEAFSLHPSWARLKRAQVAAVRQTGYPLLCYTVNDPSAFAPYWSWGVNCAITDQPSAFQRYLDSH